MIIVYEDGLKHYDHLTIPCQIENHIIFVYLLVRDLSLKIQEQTMQKTDRTRQLNIEEFYIVELSTLLPPT